MAFVRLGGPSTDRSDCDVLIVLDSGSLGLLSNPTSSAEPRDIRQWALRVLDEGATIVVPEIADYEVRRELLRADKRHGIERLDELTNGLVYDPLRTSHFRHAAALWADARNRGAPAAQDAALDGDVLLAAQALGLAAGDPETYVVTTNPKHLKLTSGPSAGARSEVAGTGGGVGFELPPVLCRLVSPCAAQVP